MVKIHGEISLLLGLALMVVYLYRDYMAPPYLECESGWVLSMAMTKEELVG